MRLILLGTSGYHPSETRQTACYMLPEAGVLLDAGTGMFRVPEFLATRTLEIFLSHAHLDHVVGLTYLLNVFRQTELETVRIHGQADKLAEIRQHLFATSLFPLLPQADWCPLGDQLSLHNGRLSHSTLEHPGGSVAYRLDWPDRSLAYVTDTAPQTSDEFAAWLQGVDVLLHECTFSDNRSERGRQTGHSWPKPVARLAERAGVGLLVLIHINPLADPEDLARLESVKRQFPNTLIAEDRMEIEF